MEAINLKKVASFFQNMILRFLSQSGLKLELRTFAVHKILMEH